VIVVVGNPILRRPASAGADPGLAGSAAIVAAAAARAGSDVELVGRTGTDPDGDAVVLALAEARIGHAALLRISAPTPVIGEPADDAPGGVAADLDAGTDQAASDPGLDEADVDLAMRYLPEIRVIVVTPEVPPGPAAVAIHAAGWTGARGIRLVPEGTSAGDLPQETIVLEAGSDPDGVFGSLVGEYAAALDRGEDASAAFRRLVGASGWEAPGGGG
jgi:sugar/nucleoside kinase (ribokinase family)